MVTLAEAWERREKETGNAYKAFLLYLEQGPARTFNETARRYYKNDKCQAHRLFEWARKNDWAGRAREYDSHLQGIAARAAEAEAAEAGRRRVETARAGVELVRLWIAGQDPASLPAGVIPQLLKVCSDLERLEDGQATERIDGSISWLELAKRARK